MSCWEEASQAQLIAQAEADQLSSVRELQIDSGEGTGVTINVAEKSVGSKLEQLSEFFATGLCRHMSSDWRANTDFRAGRRKVDTREMAPQGGRIRGTGFGS